MAAKLRDRQSLADGDPRVAQAGNGRSGRRLGRKWMRPRRCGIRLSMRRRGNRKFVRERGEEVDRVFFGEGEGGVGVAKKKKGGRHCLAPRYPFPCGSFCKYISEVSVCAHARWSISPGNTSDPFLGFIFQNKILCNA